MPTALDLDLRAPPETRSVQERKFAALLRQVLRGNAFYQQKYAALGFGPERPVGISDLQNLPLLGREELVRDLREHPPYGTNLSFPLGKFVRTSESSSAAGERLVWLDTAESWRWCLERWLDGYRSAGIGAEDRVLVVGGVGAELEAAQLHGALAIPGSSADPCELLQRALSYDVNLLVCSPLDAIALGEAASMAGEPLAQGRLRAVVLGAEAVAARADDRETLERAWGTETHEVAWSVELGAWGFGCSERDRLHVNETEYLAEVVGGDEGLDSGELVLTQLGRVGSPLIRYRTGRRVELSRSPCACGCGAVSVFTPEVTKAKA